MMKIDLCEDVKNIRHKAQNSLVREYAIQQVIQYKNSAEYFIAFILFSRKDSCLITRQDEVPLEPLKRQMYK